MASLSEARADNTPLAEWQNGAAVGFVRSRRVGRLLCALACRAGWALCILYWFAASAIDLWRHESNSWISSLWPRDVRLLLPRLAALLLLIVLFRIVRQMSRRVRRLKAGLALKTHLLNAANDALALYRPDGTRLYANDRHRLLTGLAGKESPGAKICPAILHADEKPLADRLRHLHPDGPGLTLTATRLDEAGRSVPMEIRAHAVACAGEAVIVSAASDLSARQCMEASGESRSVIRRDLAGVVDIIIQMVEARDSYTALHQRNVARLCAAIARKMGLSEDQVIAVQMAALVHDVGKNRIPAEILSKPGVLTRSELGIVKEHVLTGYDLLKGIPFPRPVAQAVWQHHERLDGSGYPCGATGSDICVEARILGVADVFDAMLSHRPYRPSLGSERAQEELISHAGTLYDPAVVRACISVLQEQQFSHVARKFTAASLVTPVSGTIGKGVHGGAATLAQ